MEEDHGSTVSSEKGEDVIDDVYVRIDVVNCGNGVNNDNSRDDSSNEALWLYPTLLKKHTIPQDSRDLSKGRIICDFHAVYLVSVLAYLGLVRKNLARHEEVSRNDRGCCTQHNRRTSKQRQTALQHLFCGWYE
jgi:hypothetical protein